MFSLLLYWLNETARLAGRCFEKKEEFFSNEKQLYNKILVFTSRVHRGMSHNAVFLKT
jgi:hypothetical protein